MNRRKERALNAHPSCYAQRTQLEVHCTLARVPTVCQKTVDGNDYYDTRGRDHETNVRRHMPRDGSAVKAGNARPKAHTTNANALQGQKVSQKMRYHFRWSPSPAHEDLMFMDLPMT